MGYVKCRETARQSRYPDTLTHTHILDPVHTETDTHRHRLAHSQKQKYRQTHTDYRDTYIDRQTDAHAHLFTYLHTDTHCGSCPHTNTQTDNQTGRRIQIHTKPDRQRRVRKETTTEFYNFGIYKP